jgi:hypothetical protein
LDAYAQQFALKKLIRELGEDACTVTGLAVIRDRAAVGMVGKRLQPHLQDGMAAAALDVGNKANPTGIMFKAGIIQPLSSMILQHNRFLSRIA